MQVRRCNAVASSYTVLVTRIIECITQKMENASLYQESDVDICIHVVIWPMLLTLEFNYRYLHQAAKTK